MPKCIRCDRPAVYFTDTDHPVCWWHEYFARRETIRVLRMSEAEFKRYMAQEKEDEPQTS